MGRGPPRGGRQPGPSPLSQTHELSRPSPAALRESPSAASLAASEARGDVTLVEDPVFWKRFGQAVHDADISQHSESAVATPLGKRISGYSGKDSWLQQQKRDKRRCRLICMLITVIAIAIIMAMVIVLVVVLKI